MTDATFHSTKTIFALAVSAALSAVCLPSAATTLVHYSMEGLAKTSYAAGTTIPDDSPSGAHPATLAEYVYGTHAYYAPLAETAAGFAGNSIRDGMTGTTSRNRAMLTFTQANDNRDGNGAALRVEEAAGDATLHLQTFTVEFMWKCAVSKNRWASPLSRIRVDPANPPVVRDGTEASTLTMFINNADGRPVQCIVATETDGGTSVKTLDLGSGADIVDGAWHHVALTLDGATRKLTLYVDAAERGSAVLDGPLVYQDANPWVFGGHGYFGWQAGGSMDEIRISDKVLAPSEFLQSVQVDALARYSLTVTPETTFAIGDTFPNRANAAAYPLTVCPAVHPLAEKYYSNGKSQYHAPKAAAFAAPFNAVQDGFGGAVETNETVLAFTQPTDTASDGFGATLQVKDATDDTSLHLQEFTIEYFWKVKFKKHWAAPLSRTRVDANGTPLGTTGDLGKDASTLTFYLDCNANEFHCIYTAQGTDGIVTADAKLCDGYEALFNDDAWHHHAVTLEAETHVLTYYLDGKAIGAITLPGPLVYAKGNAWTFGGYGFFGWQAGGSMDEIRISPVVRAPNTFLRPSWSTAPKEPLAYFPLDGDLKSLVHPELGADEAALDGIVSPLMASGNLGFGTDCPGSRITDLNGTLIRSRNSKSLSVTNLTNGLVFPVTGYRFDRSNGLTCEFFAKATMDDIKKGAWAVLLAWRNSAGNRYPVCFQENGSGMLSLRADVGTSGFVTLTSTTNPFDGAWHHIACTLQPDAGDTIVRYYIDGVLQTWQRATGMMPDMPESALEIGTRANAVQIDEVRFSNGVLDTSDFLQPRPPAGLVIEVR